MFEHRHKLYILLFFILLFSYSYFVHRVIGKGMGGNEASRLDLVYSMAERHSFNIDPYQENTIDKAFYKGHYYSDKAPGLSFSALPFSILLKFIIELFNLPITFVMLDGLLIPYLLTLFCVGIPSAFAGVLFYKFIGYFTDNKLFQLAVALGYSLCTLTFPYSTLFISHQFSAVLGFIAFFLAFEMRQKNANNTGLLFAIGLLMGYAILSEYPTGITAIALLLYMLSFLKTKANILFFIAGLFVPMLLLMYYNYSCFDNPFVLSYKFEAPNPLFEGMKEGFFGITKFSFNKLYGITFGPYRGLYRTSPLLLLSIPGFYYFFKKTKYRPEFYFSLFVVLGFIILNSSYYMWYGGTTTGPRHIIPSLPFMSIGLIFFLERFKKTKLANSIFKVLFIFSFFMMFFGTAIDPRLATVKIPLNIFIVWRIFFGTYSPNIGTLIFGPFPRIAFIISLLPLIAIIFLGLQVAIKYSSNAMEKGHSLIRQIGQQMDMAKNIMRKRLFAVTIITFFILLEAASLFMARDHFIQQHPSYDKELISKFKKAIVSNRRDAQAYHNLGSIFFELRLYGKAVSYYKKAVKIKPDNYRYLFELGTAYLAKGSFNKSIACLKKAIDLNPEYESSYTNLGQAYRAVGENELALSSFGKSLAINPRNYYSCYNMALTYFSLKLYQEAIKYFKETVEINPYYAHGYFYLGLIYKEMNNNALLNEQYSKLVKLDRKDLAKKIAFKELNDSSKLMQEYDLEYDLKK